MTLQTSIANAGQWVEIDDGEWVYFEPLPLPDEEVISQFSQIRNKISSVAKEESDLQTQINQLKLCRENAVVRKFSGKAIADGRDLNHVAPVTTKKIQELTERLRDVQSQFDRLVRERAELEMLYPATLLKAGLIGNGN